METKLNPITYESSIESKGERKEQNFEDTGGIVNRSCLWVEEVKRTHYLNQMCPQYYR